MIGRIIALFHARNLEFVRDRSALAWNLVAPALLVFGLAAIFAPGDKPLFKVAVLSGKATPSAKLHPFLGTRHVDFFSIESRAAGVRKVSRHQVDMLLDFSQAPLRYWINSSSAKGYVLERLLLGPGEADPRREVADGEEIRYVDWLVPGILGMNMMFSCLFGVGYVIVRYRKNGYLRRLAATPLRTMEFIAAQIGSRLLLIGAITVVVFIGTDYFFDFRMEGSYLALFIVAMLGAVAMISMGLLIAARVQSEELANGLLNLVTWPMMLLSGVWFSLEGSPESVQLAAELLPLSHLLNAARAVMLEGATLVDIGGELALLAAMSALFMGVGAALFRWTPE